MPETLAVTHGSSFTGDGERALRDRATIVRERWADRNKVEHHRRTQP
jgi:hypothetical protein